eukprot:3853989-Rhodomonas_salina.1
MAWAMAARDDASETPSVGSQRESLQTHLSRTPAHAGVSAHCTLRDGMRNRQCWTSSRKP